jgi:arylsulfatase A-like enzyme
LTEQVDKLIGQILDGLKEAGREKDTLVIFTSDHGNMDASHHLASKGLFYEESVGVPFIMKYPGEIPEGIIDIDNLISTGLDILPTMCEYAGLEKPEHMLGKSLRLVAERGDSSDSDPYVTSENSWFRMIRTDNYKYCAFRDDDSKEWLGDMINDPGEMRNLVDDPEYKKTLEMHRNLFKEWCKISDDKDGEKYE